MKFKAATAAFLLTMLVGANTMAEIAHPVGMAAPAAAATRQVTIDAKTKYVNANQGDTIRFVSQGKSFTWNFDTLSLRPIPLKEIAPPEFGDSSVIIYMDVNPLYRN